MFRDAYLYYIENNFFYLSVNCFDSIAFIYDGINKSKPHANEKLRITLVIMLSSLQQFNVRNTVLKFLFVFHCVNFKISMRKTSLFYWVYLKFSDVKNQYGKEYMTKLVYLKFKTLILRQVWPFLSVPIINIICTKWSSSTRSYV